MDLVWRRQAERDLEHIFEFVLQHDPGAARHMGDRIEAGSDNCATTHTWVGQAGSPGRVS